MSQIVDQHGRQVQRQRSQHEHDCTFCGAAKDQVRKVLSGRQMCMSCGRYQDERDEDKN